MLTRPAVENTNKSKLPVARRKVLLIQASDSYMRGDTSLKAFQAAAREFGTDYNSATLEMVSLRVQIKQKLIFWMSHIKNRLNNLGKKPSHNT